MNWEHAILWYVTFLVSVTVHEAAHALFAFLGGDRTAYHTGQVSLNPLPHIRQEPVGMVALPLLSLYFNGGNWCFGFARTPFDPIWAYHHPRKAALMAAAGPIANVVVAAIAFAVLWFVGRPESGTTEAVRRIAGTFLVLNLILALFNCIPLPPLDGAGVLKGLGPAARKTFELLEGLPWIAVVTFVVASKVLPYIFWPVFNSVTGWLPYPYRP